MKTLKLFSMAALALTFVACSNDDNEIQQPAQQGPITFTATLAAPNSGATNRTTATADGSNYNVAWKVGDKIALIYEVSSTRYLDEATVTAVDGSGNATISGTLSVSVAGGEAVTLVYPYDVVKSADEDLDTGKAYEPNPAYFNSQTGAAPTDANGLPKFDWRDGSGTFSVSGTSVTLSSNVTMGFNTAIWKLNLTSDGTTPLVSHTVSLNCPIPVSMAAFPDDVSEFYLYVPIPLYNFIKSIGTPPLEIEAESGGKFYSYTHDAVTLTAGKIYESTVTLAFLNEFEVSGGGQQFTIFYNDGETWAQAIDNHPFKNAGWMISGGCVLFTTGYEIYLLQDNHSTNISPTATIDKTVTYKWTSFL